MRTLRAQNQARTRESLRKSAAQSFVRTGVASTNIEQVAQHAGFTRGAFYANYASKLDLLIDVLAARQIEEIGAWREVLRSTGDIDSLLEDLSATFAARLERRSFGPLLAVELELEANRNPDFRPHYVAYLDQLFDAIALFLETLLAGCGKRVPAAMHGHVVAVRALSLTWSSEVVGESRAGRSIDGRAAMRALLESIIAAAPDLAGRHTAEDAR